MAHFNIASLMACGAIDGTEQEILYHLDFCKSFPDDKKDLVKSNLKKRMLMSDKKIIKYLFFDTETTGIPADYNASSSDFEWQLFKKSILSFTSYKISPLILVKELSASFFFILARYKEYCFLK